MNVKQEKEQPMNFFHLLGLSSQHYTSPINVIGTRPKTYLELGMRSPAHKGPFRYAEDLIAPDPRTDKIPVFAPHSGLVVALVRGNTVWGETREYAKYLNYISVQVTGKFREDGAEFYELAHMDFTGFDIKIGDIVAEGDQIGWTGLNGWITSTNGIVDSHLHFLVGVWLKNLRFKSLKIRYKS